MAYALAGVLVVADQASKLAALAWLTPYQPLALLPGLNLTLVYNTGAAFSFLQGAGGWQRWALSAFAAAVAIAIIVVLPRLARGERLNRCALVLILGGALGNLADRLRLGMVVDFVDVYAGAWHWPAFNLADSAITVGAALLVLGALGDFRTRRGSGRTSA